MAEATEVMREVYRINGRKKVGNCSPLQRKSIQTFPLRFKQETILLVFSS